jgi:hypothetical protein
MRFWYIAAAVCICCSAMGAGCPNTDLGTGCDCGNVIPDGTYIGDTNGTFESWYGSNMNDQKSGSGQTSATFVSGYVVKDSGYDLQIGDVENMSAGSFSASRQVTDVQAGNWAYEVDYDVSANWGGIPMSGTEYITFSGNEDGSIAMFDTMELTSLSSYDGGAWTFHVNSSGTLYPSYDDGSGSGNGSGDGSGVQVPNDNLSNPLLDIKSGR